MSKRKKTGLSPGSIIFTGQKKLDHPEIISLEYEPEFVKNIKLEDILNNVHSLQKNIWIDVHGIHDVALIKDIGEHFMIHKLVLEDIADPSQRTKIEPYDMGIFAIINNLNYDVEAKQLKQEQIAIFFTKNWLVDFQEHPDDTFLPIRNRLMVEHSRLRTLRCDYLFYALLDYIVDCYFLVTDAFDAEITDLEEKVHLAHTEDLINRVYKIRSNLLKFRKFIYPLREEIGKIKKLEGSCIETSNLIYFRDLEDHITHITEIVDNQRELLNGIKDLAINQTSLNMNKDIKWLTVISTISIPILFLTGVYGMNFKFMPELEWHYGYLLWWVSTISIICTLILYFNRKKMF